MICISGARECDGCMWCHDDNDLPHCPVCDADAETFYFDKLGDIFGCDKCVKLKDAWECEEHCAKENYSS